MRTLKFIVKDQIITKDPDCDFDNLVPGTEGYLKATFSFSPEWDDCIKIAGFFSVMGTEFQPQFLKDGKSCLIPSEACKNDAFKIQVVGKGVSKRITTNRLTINQNGGQE